MAEPKQTLIIIPDISGFTNFVNEVAITHAEHIIRELLEIIIDANNLALNVSEVEGDAVLFYKTKDLPRPFDILKMVETMFIRFHEHLQLYEKNRLCQCGACQTAHELNLKVIIDQGELKPIKVKDHNKLIGPALVAAHRLLKNHIPSDEYLLLSERYVDFQQCLDLVHHFEWIDWQEGVNEYEDFGQVNFRYTLLSPLKQSVRSPEDRKQEFSVKYPLTIRQEVNVNYQQAYQVINQSQKKVHWVKGLSKVIKKSNQEIDRIGTKHLCVFNGAEMTFEAVANQEKTDELEFMEVMQQMGPLKNVAYQYRCIHKGENQSLVELAIHIEAIWWKTPIKAIALWMIQWQMKQSLKQLKHYLESLERS